ncbi:hypothetical protein AcetOrient_orf01366 [Acetobacter orientalis]|uniref:Uncharacterized protein n=1 Tax=Acetobacter orientalis TaxID=146474 RepID=A0A2Z5ZFH5_9PROT|nr:hypothetical protein AcetOrient_orf01366 [Acetobacter orientalis]
MWASPSTGAGATRVKPQQEQRLFYRKAAFCEKNKTPCQDGRGFVRKT